ncbi:hypothetical protein, partial [Aeromonas veronii]|uniref:hypothetical protein n=1 Tax=Aeromonas veronii TaxID=654 RepID=UPI003D1EBD2D
NTMTGCRQQKPKNGLTKCPDLVDHYKVMFKISRGLFFGRHSQLWILFLTTRWNYIFLGRRLVGLECPDMAPTLFSPP